MLLSVIPAFSFWSFNHFLTKINNLAAQLSGASQSTFEEFVRAIVNRSDSSENYNAALLYEKDDKMLPIRSVQIPVNHEMITKFRVIVMSIKEKRQLTVTNNSFSGRVYPDQVVFPYKLEYSPQFDSFSLSCYPLNVKRPVKMNLANISTVSIGDKIAEYDKFIADFEKQLSDTKVTHPIQLEILNQDNAYDRCTYLFSSYDTYCYDKGEDRLIMNIYPELFTDTR